MVAEHIFQILWKYGTVSRIAHSARNTLTHKAEEIISYKYKIYFEIIC